MARPEQRKARKDYPEGGIKAGETYWYVKLKTQYGGIVKRSKTPFKASQLTQSPFKSGWFAVGEDWDASAKDVDAINDAAADIRSLGEDAQASFDSMPEGLQQGETGQLLENRASECEDRADQLEALAMEMADADDDEDEAERITDAAGDLIGDMPE